MNDILTQEDLYILVNEFYKKLLTDDAISYIFTDVVQVHIESHLPILVTFWSQAILGTGGYTKNLTQIHVDVNTKEYLSPALFKIWLNHFYASVDELFRGVNAEKIKTQALNIATVIQIKIENQKSSS